MKLHASLEHFFTLKKFGQFIFFLLLFQSRCASSESMAAIFQQSAGYVFSRNSKKYVTSTLRNAKSL